MVAAYTTPPSSTRSVKTTGVISSSLKSLSPGKRHAVLVSSNETRKKPAKKTGVISSVINYFFFEYMSSADSVSKVDTNKAACISKLDKNRVVYVSKLDKNTAFYVSELDKSNAVYISA